MTEKHTPGPWEAAIQNGCHGVIASISGEPKAVAIVVNNNPDDGNEPSRVANARLIAAAPELLEALSEYLSAMDGATFHFDKPGAFKAVAAAEKARKVIAKGTGDAP